MERETELSGVMRPSILSAPWAEVRGADVKEDCLWCEGVKGKEVGDREDFDSAGDSGTVVNIVEGVWV